MGKETKQILEIKSFTLGYRYSMINSSHREILGNLIEEIVEHSSPEVLSAFLKGENHGNKERKVIEASMKQEEAIKKDEEERINREVEELRKIRQFKQQEKDQSKGR